MPFLSGERTDTYYEIHGDDQNYPVILIHPIGGNILIWKEEIDLLLKYGFRVVAYELRGHHRTNIGTIKAFAIQELVQDLLSLLKHLKITRCTLVGHSIGGIIASLYVAQYPESSVDAIVLINSSPKKIPDRDLEKHFQTREIAVTKGISALAEFTLKKDKQSRDMARNKKHSDFFREVFTKTSVDGFVASTLSLYTIPEDVIKKLKSSGCKTLGIVGSEDDVFLRLLRQTKADMPQMKLQVIQGSDHWLVIEKPREMHDVLMDFLANIVPARNESTSGRSRLKK